jgi:hypothetical protein
VDGFGQLIVGAGRYYVDGLLVENEAATAVPSPKSGPGRYLVYLDVWEREVTALDDLSLRDPAVDGPDTSVRLKVVWQLQVQPADVDPTGDEERPTLDVTTGAGGYQGAENALYRVEIHDAGQGGKPTFKWSRDNGSTIIPVSNIHGDTIVVSDLGALVPHDWLELLDADLELEGRAGQLAQVVAIDSTKNLVKLTVPVDVNLSKRPRVRRWDGAGEVGQSVALEQGIEVRFGGSGYQSGDYWTFPARPANKGIEWLGGPQPAARIEHRYCPLAVLKLGKKGGWRVVKDQRRQFQPQVSSTAKG